MYQILDIWYKFKIPPREKNIFSPVAGKNVFPVDGRKTFFFLVAGEKNFNLVAPLAEKKMFLVQKE